MSLSQSIVAKLSVKMKPIGEERYMTNICAVFSSISTTVSNVSVTNMNDQEEDELKVIF